MKVVGVTKDAVLRILESKCDHLEFTATPGSRCSEMSIPCRQENCPIRTGQVADAIVEYIRGLSESLAPAISRNAYQKRMAVDGEGNKI